MDSGTVWIRLLQILLGLVCLLTAGGNCFIGVMVWSKGDSREKRIRAVLLGSGLGWLFGASLTVLFASNQWVEGATPFQMPLRAATGACCWGVLSAFLFAAAVQQFVWLRRYRRK